MGFLVLPVAIGAAAVGGWFLLYTLILLATRPARPDPAPATRDLPGSEPPAVVSLLAGYWELSEDAAESTLIDLAARRYLEFRQPGNDPMQTTVHVRNPDPTGLLPYERRILDRVTGLAVGGVVPLPALTFRDPGQAAAFDKRLRAEVIADARARGLSRRRLGPALLTLLSGAALVAGLIVGGAVALGTRHRRDPGRERRDRSGHRQPKAGLVVVRRHVAPGAGAVPEVLAAVRQDGAPPGHARAAGHRARCARAQPVGQGRVGGRVAHRPGHRPRRHRHRCRPAGRHRRAELRALRARA